MNRYVSTSNILMLFLLIYLLSGCSSDSSTKPIDTVEATIQCSGVTIPENMDCITLESRDITVYAPDLPIKGIAILLHGAPGSPKKVNTIFNSKLLGDTQNLLVATPQGINRFWGWDSVNDTENKLGDVNFLSSVIDQLKIEYNITSDIVYFLGYSAGGFMTYKLACTIPEKITGIVALAGQFRGEFEKCSTATPVAIHHIHSYIDSEVPIIGRELGRIRSVDETIAHWQLKNGCSNTFETIQQAKVTAVSNGTTTQVWQDCSKPVTFSEIDNVPHTSNYDSVALLEIYGWIFN
ncbi:hypothetical protein Q4575_12215 [Psychrosphaera sp. 1_MG-2023]|uniref:alpha/beta hydrolase family esterase n=1 Tax=Psychrosphaera sp. 1_MG-2023 TaxID=3062643 RepID=UPI0026E3961D|nr:hypothetical protein [Psychrosphaera sp. 1_MG-2023]MDO6720173.1 hypothetical protein [Psychrosphaera sp. 1_MG-2023]